MLLADDVIAHISHPAIVKKRLYRDDLVTKIKDAQKFVLSATALDAVFQIHKSKPSSLLEAMPLCRPPYKLTWIERVGAATNDKTWDNSEARPEAIIPEKFGMLIEYLEDSGQNFRVSCMWKQKLPPELNPIIGIVICPIDMCFVVGDHTYSQAIKNVAEFLVDKNLSEQATKLLNETVSYWAEKNTAMLTNPFFDIFNDKERKAAMILEDRVTMFPSLCYVDPGSHIKKSDWFSDIAAEGGLLLSTLALLNSRNNISIENQDFKKLNKKRVRNGRSELMSYNVVKIVLSKRDRLTALSEGMTDYEIRKHLVRGHFKIKKNGIYWWRPFIRGSYKNGEANRSHYDVVL